MLLLFLLCSPRGSLKMKIVQNLVQIIIPCSQWLARCHVTRQRCSVAPAPKLSAEQKSSFPLIAWGWGDLSLQIGKEFTSWRIHRAQGFDCDVLLLFTIIIITGIIIGCRRSGIQLLRHGAHVQWNGRSRVGSWRFHRRRLLPATAAHGLRQIPGMLSELVHQSVVGSVRKKIDRNNFFHPCPVSGIIFACVFVVK